MADFDLNLLKIKLKEVLGQHLSKDAFSWLTTEADALVTTGDIRRFNTAFVMMPRKTGKGTVHTTSEIEADLARFRTGFTISQWSTDRLSRVWLIMHLHAEPTKYFETIENLFLNAEMNELVALYSSLPVLEYPERWQKRCAEGIRNNIATVLESIMCNNPYPAEQLDEAAWNQLVLKAIFTEKPLLEIQGLRERSNKTLAESISSFAHERWAAGRQVNPLVWICVTKFVDESLQSDIQRLAYSTDSVERQAAALVCQESDHPAAKNLLAQIPELKSLITKDNISWMTLESELNELKQVS
jgi:hypothetical protein